MATITVSQLRGWRPEALNQAAADLRRAATRADEQRDALRGVWDKRLAPTWGGLAAHAGMEAAATQHETLLTLIDTLTGSAAVLVSAADAFRDAQRRLEDAVAMARSSDLTMAEDGQVAIDATVYSALQQADPYALDAIRSTAERVSVMAQSALRAAEDADHVAATQLAAAAELVQGIRLSMGSSGTGTRAVELTPAQLSSLGRKVTDIAGKDLGPNGPTAIAAWWQEHGDATGDWSPVDKFVAGSSLAWSAAVFAPNLLSCTTGPGTTGSSGYAGGGFLIGPDGRKYPLVEPYITGPDGKTINADVAASTEHDVTTLDGRDTGWHDLGTVVGSDKFGTVGTTTKILAGLGVAAGGAGPITTAQPAWLNGLSIGHGGYAVVTDTPDSLAHSVQPGQGITEVNPAYQQVTTDERGRTTIVEEPANPANYGSRVVTANGVALGINVLNGVSVAEHLDDSQIHAYQVTFQQNDDGRVRALMHSYQVVDNTQIGGGSHDLYSSYVTADSDGKPVYSPMKFRSPDHAVLLPAPAK